MITATVPIFDQRYIGKGLDLQRGEEFATLAKQYGELAGRYLFRAQWGYGEPEWFDHRLHFLIPEDQFTDFWTASADNVIRCLPYNGRLLDLCSGDGFYDYWFFRKRADVVAVEKNQDAYDCALRNHAHGRIKYVLTNVLEYDPEPEAFDVVLIRGAIEHFNAENQQRLFRISWEALKPGGYFCGDTPAKNPEQDKMLAAHEHEWIDEAEMREALKLVFTEIETWTLQSEFRTTLFWRCRKNG